MVPDTDQVFVIRFRQEDELPEEKGKESVRHWRARITYVGQEYYANSIEDVFAIVTSLLITGKFQR